MNIKDITDFRDQQGNSALLDAIANFRKPFKMESSPENEESLPEIINAKALVEGNPKQPPQLVHGLLHQGSKMVLGGGSKSYKTWSLLDLGMSVACGQTWWGFETTRSRVLYINLELAEWSFKERVDSITAKRPELADLSQFDVWNLRGYAVSLDKMRPKIISRVASDYGLIIIDPIYKVYGPRDENSAGEMGELLNEIECLAVKTNAAVVFGAHFSKGNQAGKESIDRISGSGVFARDPDTILVMTKHEMEDTYTVEATLRNLKPIPSFCVQRAHPLMERNDSVDPKKLKKPGVKTEQYPVALLLKSLGVDELTTTEWELRSCKDCGMKSRTFMAKLAEIRDDPEIVTKSKEGKWRATSPIYPPGWHSSAGNTMEVQKCN